LKNLGLPTRMLPDKSWNAKSQKIKTTVYKQIVYGKDLKAVKK
jgi:hypothetical protein